MISLEIIHIQVTVYMCVYVYVIYIQQLKEKRPKVMNLRDSTVRGMWVGLGGEKGRGNDLIIFQF